MRVHWVNGREEGLLLLLLLNLVGRVSLEPFEKPLAVMKKVAETVVGNINGGL